MAKFFEALAGSFSGRSVIKALKRLGEDRTPVRVEVEGSEFSFYTVVSLRPEVVVVARPLDIELKALVAGGLLRFVVPDGSKNVVRMVVRDPRFQRERGDAVILCEIPEDFAEKSKRGEDRFNTTRFKNLKLSIPQVEAQFRIIDISPSGCKTYVQELEDWDLITPGVTMRFTKVTAGEKVQIDFATLTPRLVNPPVVNFAWEVAPVGPSAGLLQHLIDSLHDKELGRLRIKERDPLAPGKGD